MDDSDGRPADPVEGAATWDATRQRQLTMGLDATPAQRLQWLEEMIAIAHGSGALPRPRGPDGELL